MRLFVVLLLMISSIAHARQYIQCEDSHSWDHAVINLNGDNSTLFLTDRIDVPDVDSVKVVKKLFFTKNTQDYSIYNTNEGDVVDIVKIPLKIIGKRSSNFKIILSHKNVQLDYEFEREMICYSAIY